MSNNEQLVKNIKRCVNDVKVWKTDKQRDYLIEKIEPYIEDMKKLSLEEKVDILHYAMFLSRKSYINILAKHFGISLNDDENVKMWRVLKDCGDNAYTLQIIGKKDNWTEFAHGEYFFEQVLLKGRNFYIDNAEKEWCKKLQTAIAAKTDVGFWLSKEKTTGLSKISYAVLKNEQWGDLNRSIIDIKPGWLEQDFYSIVNVNKNNKHLEQDRFSINEDKVDWNTILKNKQVYPEEAKNIVRNILENFWLQKTPEGNFVFESPKVKAYVLTSTWLFNKNHLEMNIFTSEEKGKLLEKLLNDKNSITTIKSASEEGKYLQNLLENCFQDNNILWHKLNLEETAKTALKMGEYDKLVGNLSLKSKLEEGLICKNKSDKKAKI